jgi:hypothetical protein
MANHQDSGVMLSYWSSCINVEATYIISLQLHSDKNNGFIKVLHPHGVTKFSIIIKTKGIGASVAAPAP